MKCIDLFCGCGGLSLGFEKSGFDIIHGFDNWEPAIDVYKKNFNHPVSKLDLTDEDTAIQLIKGLQPDLIMGGPPCQDFSSAGKRDLSGGRASLTYHFTNIVCGVKPTWFVMENVEQIKKSHILHEVVIKFKDEGYGLSSVILDASYCGVPQTRTRFFLIGHLHDQHNQLNQLFKQRLANQAMTIKNYLGDSLGIEFYYRHPRNYNRRGVFSIHEPSPTIRGVNRPVPSGYQLNSCDPKGLNLKKIRPLTTIERSYIQTFPKSFYFEGTKTNLEQMIGNAVPVNLAKFVADTIIIYIKKGVQKELTLFDLDHQFEIPKKVLHRTE